MTRRPKRSRALTSLLMELSRVTGMDDAQAQATYEQTVTRLQHAQSRLVQLVGDGQPTLTVRPSLLLDGAHTYENVRDVTLPGYQVRPMPEADVDARARSLIREALQSLQSTYRTAEAIQTWLRTPSEAFDGRRPLDLLLEGFPTAICTVLEASKHEVFLCQEEY